MKQTIFILFLFLGAAISVSSCKHQPVYPANPAQDTTKKDSTECDQSVVYFENEVLPILVSNCTMSGCHNASSAQDGVVLESYSSLMASNVVNPYNASDSDIIEALLESDPDKHMPPPPSASLSPQQITTISNWINQGAQNTICTAAACDTSSVTFSASIKPIIQNKCQGCHSGSNPSGGYDFTTHAGVAAVKTKLFGAVNHLSGYIAMPQGGNKLPACDIRKIKLWVDAGALNN